MCNVKTTGCAVSRRVPSCPPPEGPLLLFGLLAIDASGADRRGVEHAGSGNVDGGGVAAFVGYYSPGLSGTCEVGVERIHAVLLAEVAFAPDAGAYPNADDSDNHNDKENHPLIVVIEPNKSMRGQHIGAVCLR